MASVMSKVCTRRNTVITSGFRLRACGEKPERATAISDEHRTQNRKLPSCPA